MTRHPTSCRSCVPGALRALGLAALQAYLFTDTRQERRDTDEPDALRRALEAYRG